jgi:hypothetical protein
MIFSTESVGGGGIKNFKYVYTGFLCCLWSDELVFKVLLMVFNLWIGPGFIFESCRYLLIFQ